MNHIVNINFQGQEVEIKETVSAHFMFEEMQPDVQPENIQKTTDRIRWTYCIIKGSNPEKLKALSFEDYKKTLDNEPSKLMDIMKAYHKSTMENIKYHQKKEQEKQQATKPNPTDTEKR